MPSKSKLRAKWDNAGLDVVVLHQFPRARTSPNNSPFPIKLETFLRMTGINFINDFEQPMGPKGKTPWITFNGYDIADSQHSIEHLSKVFNIDLDSHLTPEEKAISRSLRVLIEDHLYFCLITERWVHESVESGMRVYGSVLAPYSPSVARSIIVSTRNRLKKDVEAQGIGRHELSEIHQLGIQDLEALSNALEDRPYLMGDKPSEVDCCLFGFMTRILCVSVPGNRLLMEIEQRFTNLKEYHERMKNKYWPDWEECKANW